MKNLAMRLGEFVNWNIHDYQRDLFVPVSLRGEIIQFTDTIITGGEGIHYFVKIIRDGSATYGFLHTGCDGDCDGTWNYYHLHSFAHSNFANMDADEFHKYYKLGLTNTQEVVQLIINYDEDRREMPSVPKAVDGWEDLYNY
jgi:hypothetical protein